MNEETFYPTLALIATILILMFFGIWYAYFQFNLCYPEISNNFWYCLKHAIG